MFLTLSFGSSGEKDDTGLFIKLCYYFFSGPLMSRRAGLPAAMNAPPLCPDPLPLLTGDRLRSPPLASTRLHSPPSTMFKFNGKTVGIFSREAVEDYQWLIDELVKFKNVKDVRPVYVSSRVEDLRQHTTQCDFAIVYHSQTTGPVNVTDVNDSLYDSELEYLSRSFGKAKVLVVIDDLDDSSDTLKRQILDDQQSIKQYAHNLFLFTRGERSFPEDESKRSKLNHIQKIIQGRFIPFDENIVIMNQGEESANPCDKCCDKVMERLPCDCKCWRSPVCWCVFVGVWLLILICVILGQSVQIYQLQESLNSATSSTVNTSTAMKP